MNSIAALNFIVDEYSFWVIGLKTLPYFGEFLDRNILNIFGCYFHLTVTVSSGRASDSLHHGLV